MTTANDKTAANLALRQDLQSDINEFMTGSSLRRIREKQGMTIEQFSKRLGISWVTLWRKEKDHSPISKSLAMAIKSVVETDSGNGHS